VDYIWYASGEEAGVVRAPTALVLVNGDDVFEDMFTAADQLADLLADAGFAERTAIGMGRFDGTGTADLIVLYTALGEFTPDQRACLDDAVRSGAGLLAVHSTNVPPELFDLIGSRYVAHGPPPHESRFTVRLDDTHEITAGIEAFDVTHEHYDIVTAPDVRVIAWRDTDRGRQPLVHVREHGAGRVCYVQWGHDMRVWGEPAVLRLVRRAACWAGKGN
jgi:type 1 glutamine amidotransferase